MGVGVHQWHCIFDTKGDGDEAGKGEAVVDRVIDGGLIGHNGKKKVGNNINGPKEPQGFTRQGAHPKDKLRDQYLLEYNL